jgi:hypothetical protein
MLYVILKETVLSSLARIAFKTEEKARAVYINAKKSLGHIKEVA